MVSIRFFGPGQLRDSNGRTIHVRARKELAILAYLLLEGAQLHSREVLQALFWPDLDLDSGRNNLRVVLSHLQALLPAEPSTPRLFQTSRTDVQLNPDAALWIDVLHFQRLIEETQRHDHASRSSCPHCQQRLAEAVALYENEVLAGVALADSPIFEEWLFLQRERQHLLALKAYHDLTTFAEGQGTLEEALRFAQRQIALDPLREAAYRQQIFILARQGERSLALAAFERCRTIISNELGIDLEPETLLLHQQILSDQIVPLRPLTPGANLQPAQLSPPLASVSLSLPAPSLLAPAPANARHNLPQHLTSFVGRELEIAQLHERLATGESRLISLVGPGGIGKTRLAIQVATTHQQFFPDGVYFVSLAGVQSVSAIPAAILDAMGATLGTGAASPIQQLLQGLAQQKMLLVIDNLEHLIDGVELLLEILQTAPTVTLLVTTREQLNCQAEDVFHLSGLAVPTQSDVTQAGQTAAVRLFCERAYRLNKEFKLTTENCPAVVKICQLVEGMPLAIELATTWLGDLDCAALAETLAHNQLILATTQRDLPTRHRSMQAVFDYSWQLLTPGEQRILSHLAICHGRFSARAANQICGASLVDLTRLRYKSLLRIAEVGYYDLHQLIRTFALATLRSDAQREAGERLTIFYMQQVANQATALDGAVPQAALRTIDMEVDNIQQAWQWAVEHDHFDLLMQGATGLGGYYTATGRNTECEVRFLPLAQQLLEQPESTSELYSRLCARLLDKVCHSLIWLGKLAEARKWAQIMVGVAQRLSDPKLVTRAYIHWGKAVDELGNPHEATQTYEEALRLARQLSDSPLVGSILIELSHSLRALGRTSETEAVLLESLQLHRSQGNRLAEQRSLLYLSVCKREEGDFQADRDYLMAAIDLLPLTGNRHVETRLLDALGINYGLVGNYRKAVEYHEASHQIAVEIHQPVQQSHTLRNLCTVHRKLGNLKLAEEYGLESLRLALANELPEETNTARLYLGYVWLATDDLSEAADAFQLAYDGWRAQEYINLSQEALVGLATVDLRRNNPIHATERIAPLVPSLMQQVQVGAREPYEMHLACYEILSAVGDVRSHALLTTAYQQLQGNVNKVTNNQLLGFFWQAPAHRRIRELWQQVKSEVQ